MSKLYILGTIGAIVSILLVVFFNTMFWNAFDKTGNGYGAKIACGAVFGADRTLESVLNAELVFPPVKFGRDFVLDHTNKCVSVRGWWFFASPARKACFRSHRLGCHLIPVQDTTNVYELPKIDSKLANENWGDISHHAAPKEWPLGNTEHKARYAAAKRRIDFSAVSRVVDAHFADTRLHARAVVLLVDGQIVYEKYGDSCTESTRLLGWSATKSVINALIGLRVQEGVMALDTSLASLISSWEGKEHLKSLTVRQALQMSDGLDIDENYIPGGPVTDMLFVNGTVIPFIHHSSTHERRPRGEGCFHYSSATTNILCQALASTFETKSEALSFPSEKLFRPLGATSFRLEADSDGSFLGSSFGWATARDWARLGLLFMNDGKWFEEECTSEAGCTSADPALMTRQMLPKDWVNFSRSPTYTSHGSYGAHFWLGGNTVHGDENDTRSTECDAIFPTRLDPPRDWLRTAFPQGTFLMHGFEEQCVAIQPERGIVLVRLGASKEVVMKWDKPAFYSSIFAAVK